MASNVNVSTDVALIDTRTKQGTLQLPLTTTIPYRVFIIKDAYGSFGSNPLTVTTQGPEVFEDGSQSKVFSDNFAYITLYGNTSSGRWQLLNSTQVPSLTVSSIVGISSITGGVFIGDGSLLSNVAGATNPGVSSLSSIVSYGLSSLAAGAGATNPGVSSLSSIVSYGLSSLAAGATNPGVSSLSSIVSYGLSSFAQVANISSLNTNNISAATGFISSIVVNSLTVGTGSGFVNIPALQTTVTSTLFLNAGNATVTTLVGSNITSSNINQLSSIISFGLSTIARIPDIGLSSLSSIVSFGLSSLTQIPDIGLSSLSSIVSFGLSSFTFVANISSLNTNNISAATGFVSSLIVNALQVGSGDGFINFPAVRAIAVSSLQENTGALYAGNAFIGTTSTVNAVFFAGLSNTFDRTVITEISTATVGIQELLLYKGGGSTDRIRLQTTGEFRLETGQSARTWPNNLQATAPTLYANITNQVGINTATPGVGVTLDVAGSGGVAGIIRTNILSSQQLFVSSIAGAVYQGDGSQLSNIGVGISSLSSVVSYGFSSLSSIYGQTFNTSTLTAINAVVSSITTSSLNAINANVSSITTSSIVFSQFAGFVSFQAIQAIAMSSIQTNTSILNATSITSPTLSLGLSSVAVGAINPGVSSLSSIVSFGLSTLARIPDIGLSSLSSIVSYGLSSLTQIPDNGLSSLSSIVSYGLSSLTQIPDDGLSTLSSIVSYGLSSLTQIPDDGLSTLSSIVSYGLSSLTQIPDDGLSTLSSIVSYGLSSLTQIPDDGLSTLSSIVSYGISSATDYISILSTGYASLFITSSLITSTLTTSTLLGTSGNVSSLTVSSLTFGVGAGFVTFPAVQATFVSSLQMNTNIFNALATNITSISSVNIQTSNILTVNISTSNIAGCNATLSSIITGAVYGPGQTNMLQMNYTTFGLNPNPVILTSSIAASGFLSFNTLGYLGQPQNMINTNLVGSFTGMFLYGTVAASLLYNFLPTTTYNVAPVNLTSVSGTSITALINNGNIIIMSKPNGTNPFSYSYDGLQWYQGVAPTGPTLGTNDIMNAFAYNGSNLWVGTGSKGSVCTSPNGITWTVRAGPWYTANATSGVAFGNGLWVATGTSNFFLSNSPTSNAISTIGYSSDGITWKSAVSGGFSNGGGGTGQSVGWNGTFWVAAGTSLASNANNAVLYSRDASNWSNATTVPAGFLSGKAVAWSPTLGIWVLGGANTPANALSNLLWSTDSVNWNIATSVAGTGPNTGVNAVIWAGNRFVAGGQTNGVGCLVTSLDGKNWIVNSNFTSLTITALTWFPNVNTNIQVSSITTTGFATCNATVANTLTVANTTNTNIINANAFSTGTFVTDIISTNAILTSSILIGAADSILDITGPVRFTMGSTIAFYASSILAGGLQLGTTSNTTVFFDGPASTYDRTTISEVAIPATASNQELLLYKGSGTVDQIRLQTTGNIVLEAGVSARIWPAATQGATPSMYFLGTAAPGASQIGINTIPTLASAITLDIASTQPGGGILRAVQLSSLQVQTSSIVANVVSTTQILVSSIQANIVSTSQIQVSSIRYGTGPGFVSFTAVQAVAMSSIQTNTSLLNAVTVSSISMNVTSNFIASSIVANSISTISIFAGSTIATTGIFSSIFAQTVSVGILNISSLNTNVLSTNIFSVSTLNVNFISSAQATFSSLIVNAMQFGSGDGYVDFGAVRAVVVSTIQENTGLLNATQVFASTISATLFPVYYNTIISTVNTGNTMFLPTSASGSYVFITTNTCNPNSNVFVSLPTTSVAGGSLFVVKHKGATGAGPNFVTIQNTASVLPVSTTTTAVYAGIEWISLGVSGSA